MNSTISCFLLGAILIGITNVSDGHSISDECVSIASNKSGKMQCEPSKHIHIETISLDNEVCPSKPSKLISSIPILTCQGIRYCSVPFKTGGKNKYMNIRYKCTGCQSAKHGTSVNITCQQNTRIKIEDVWMNWKTACPAYNDTHHPRYHSIHTMCNSKQTCTVNNSRFQIMSIYFSCEGLTTKNRSSASKNATIYVDKKIINWLLSKTTLTSLNSTIVPQVKPLKVNDQIASGVIAAGVLAGHIILFVLFGVLLYRRNQLNCLKHRRATPTYESTTVREANDREYSNIEISPDTKKYSSEDGHSMSNSRQPNVNTEHISYDYVNDSQNDVEFEQ